MDLPEALGLLAPRSVTIYTTESDAFNATATRHGFRCHESARSKCDPFEVNRGGTLERILDVLLSFLQGQHGGAGVLLEIVNIAAQGGDGLFLLAGFGSGAVSLGLSLRSRRLALIEALLQLLH